MTHHLALIMLCQLAGDLVTRALGLSFPGPLLGMLILLGILALTGGPADGMRTSAGALIDHLGLFIVPIATGFVTLSLLFLDEAFAIAVAIVLSTVAAMALTATISSLGRRDKPETAPDETESSP